MFSAFRSLCTILLSCWEEERGKKTKDRDVVCFAAKAAAHLNSAGGLPCAWLQTGPGKTPACSLDLTGAPWCWYGRIALPRWHTPSPSRAASASPPPRTSRLCWGEPASPCRRPQRWKGLAIARPVLSYPGLSRLLSLSDKEGQRRYVFSHKRITCSYSKYLKMHLQIFIDG